ncbi:MAG: multidrug efflux SMR transporter [Hyphomonas sp.]|nr:multidrug efflux SMR transporter [Hyphomonas sp.]
MSWVYLLLAGLLEIAWAIGLKLSDGFTRPAITAATVAAMVGSFALLALALRTLPIGNAYAVWTGIGTIGTVVIGILWFGEQASFIRLVFIGLIVAGIAGLKLTS